MGLGQDQSRSGENSKQLAIFVFILNGFGFSMKLAIFFLLNLADFWKKVSSFSSLRGWYVITKQKSLKLNTSTQIIFLKMMSCPTHINRVWLEAISYLSPDRAKYWERKTSQQSDYVHKQESYISLSLSLHALFFILLLRRTF